VLPRHALQGFLPNRLINSHHIVYRGPDQLVVIADTPSSTLRCKHLTPFRLQNEGSNLDVKLVNSWKDSHHHHMHLHPTITDLLALPKKNVINPIHSRNSSTFDMPGLAKPFHCNSNSRPRALRVSSRSQCRTARPFRSRIPIALAPDAAHPCRASSSDTCSRKL